MKIGKKNVTGKLFRYVRPLCCSVLMLHQDGISIFLLQKITSNESSDINITKTQGKWGNSSSDSVSALVIITVILNYVLNNLAKVLGVVYCSTSCGT